MLTNKAIEAANRLANGEVFFSQHEPRMCPIIRDQLRSAGLEISSEGIDNIKFFASNLIRFRQALSKMARH